MKDKNHQICVATSQDIKLLKQKALARQEKRARLCLHQCDEDLVHQMIIALCEGVYVRPHKHVRKTEAFHLIEGKLLVVTFDDFGNTQNKIVLSNNKHDKTLICYLGKNIWHMVISLCSVAVFQEITNGPYTGKNDSCFPSWAPDGSDAKEKVEYLKNIKLDL